jgi:periplasmic protein CpxP/Spy
MNEQSATPANAGPASPDGSYACGHERHSHRRGGSWRKLLGATVIVGLVAGAAYMGAGHAHGLRGGHGMATAGFNPEAAAKRIDAVVSYALADINGTAEQKARIGDIAKGAMTDLLPLRAEHRASRDKAVELLSAATIDRAALEQVRAAELKLAETASKRLTQAIADAAETLEPAQRAQLIEKMKQRMGRHG